MDRSSLSPEAEAFLAVAADFQLGHLVTESPHPLTEHLSDLASSDLDSACGALKSVDLLALGLLAGRVGALRPLAEAVNETLRSGGKLFFCGCGATGRLSLSLEVFARDGLLGDPVPAGQVVGFMAGGDAALIRSIESFEDHPEWGSRMLDELGFGANDLLISTTEGGETPYVIGATERAAEVSDRAPFFLYCNPDDLLAKMAERSRHVIENPGIHTINLTVGPMAVTGSTRMQASTVLMAAVGWAVMHRDEPDEIPESAAALQELVIGSNYTKVAPFVAREAAIYQNGGRLLYDPGPFGITVVTDTTERSPTFTLTPFENSLRPGEPTSLCYVYFPDARDGAAAWRELLGRAPRGLEWDGLSHLTGMATIMGYDFSEDAPELRDERTGGAHQFLFTIRDSAGNLTWELDGLITDWPVGIEPPFHHHLLLKMLLNTHSTLVMGRLGRYEGNVMTYVSPSNFKLIDRAARYVRLLLARHSIDPTYDDVVRTLFEVRKNLGPDEPVVPAAAEVLRERLKENNEG